MVISTQIVSILLGVISGIVTTIFLWLFSIVFKNVLLPWFQELVYRGVNITGNWTHKHSTELSLSTEKQIFEIGLDIKQIAHRVSGTFWAKTIHNSKEYVNYYKIKGVVKDNYVLFTYNAQRKDRTGYGSFLLRVSYGGTQLRGSAVFTPDGNEDDSCVTTREDMVFKRN